MKNSISVSEVSRLLNCSLQRVRDLDNSGELTADSRQGGQRRYLRAKVLAYMASHNAIQTFVYIGLLAGEPGYEEWKSKALDFCEINSLPTIELMDPVLEPLKSDPLLLSRHLVAQIAEHRPRHIVICCPDTIEGAALSTVIDVAKLFRINAYCLFGSGAH